MNGARRTVIKTRTGTLFHMVCDKPAAQRIEQIGVTSIQAVQNHCPRPALWPDIESANSIAISAGAKNSSNKIVPPQAGDTLEPPASVTLRSHGFSLHWLAAKVAVVW